MNPTSSSWCGDRSWVAVLPLLAFAPPALAQTNHALSLTGYSLVDLELLDLPGGAVSQMGNVRWVAMGSLGEMSELNISGDCQGLGLTTVGGDYSGRWQCTNNVSAADAFYSTITDSAEGGEFVVDGGTGAFEGATGSGTLTYTWGDSIYGDRIAWVMEGTVTTP